MGNCRAGYRRHRRQGPVAYHHPITGSPDDLAQQLEQLFDRASNDDAGEAAPPDPDVATDFEADLEAEMAEAVGDHAEPTEEPSELRHQMDLLRDQLEVAFDEVVTRIGRVEQRLTSSAINELEERSNETLALLHRLVTTVDRAVELAEEPLDWPPAPTTDVSAQIEDYRIRMENRLDTLHTQIGLLRDVPPTVDVAELEEVANRGALRNAADIATVRQGVESLADLVRLQEKSITELRTTLEWIKERLLLR